AVRSILLNMLMRPCNKTPIFRVIENALCRNDMHFDIAIRQVAIPRNRENLNLMASAHHFPGDTQHVALHAAEGKILENQESKLQSTISLNKGHIVCENAAYASIAHRQDHLSG